MFRRTNIIRVYTSLKVLPFPIAYVVQVTQSTKNDARVEPAMLKIIGTQCTYGRNIHK